MPDYINKGGAGDAGLAIIIGLAVGLFLVAVVGSDKKSVEKPKKAEAVQLEIKPTEQPKVEQKQIEKKKVCVEEHNVHHAAWTQFISTGKSVFPIIHPAYDTQVCDRWEVK